MYEEKAVFVTSGSIINAEYNTASNMQILKIFSFSSFNSSNTFIRHSAVIGKYIYLNKHIISVFKKPRLNIPFFVIRYITLNIQSIPKYIILFFLCTDLFTKSRYITIANRNNPLTIIPIVNGKLVNLTIKDVNKSSIGCINRKI